MKKSGWSVELLGHALEHAREYRAEIVSAICQSESFSETLAWKLYRVVECEIEISYLERTIEYGNAGIDIDEARCKAAEDLVRLLIDDGASAHMDMIHGAVQHLRRRAISQILRRYSPHSIRLDV